MLDSFADWLQFSSEEEASEFLVFGNNGKDSPFLAIERWMEVIARPPWAVWLRFRGVPQHVWMEGIFRLLGDCVGKTLEVDIRTVEQELLLFGKVKVMSDDFWNLPKEIILWLDDLRVPVKVEQDNGDCQQEEGLNIPDLKRFRCANELERWVCLDSNRACSGTEVEDDDASAPKFQIQNWRFWVGLL